MSLRRTFRRLRVALAKDGRTVLELHRELSGQLAMEEVRFLYRAAHGRERIVEIGSFRGKSCVIMALGSASVGGRITAIDPHIADDPTSKTDYNRKDLDAFNETIERWGVADRVDHLVMKSHHARQQWNDANPIDLLWIDGDHSYEGVREDLDDWRELVRPGGIIACHDYTHRESVRRGWAETIAAEPEKWTTTGGRVRSIRWATRRSV